MDNKIISIKEMQKQSTQILPLPNFKGDGYFNVKVKRASLTGLVKANKIPNPLMEIASQMFTHEVDLEKVDLTAINEVMDIMVDSVLVEPSYDEIKDAGLELTDEQKNILFEYSQSGVRNLDYFREIEEDNDSTKSSKAK